LGVFIFAQKGLFSVIFRKKSEKRGKNQKKGKFLKTTSGKNGRFWFSARKIKRIY